MSLRGLVAGCAIVAMVGVGFLTLPALAQDQDQPQPPGQLASLPPDSSTREMIDVTVKAHPEGGEALTADIQKIVCDRPENAADVATYLRAETDHLNNAQKDAVERGLAECLNYLGVTGFFPAAVLGIGPLLGAGVGIGGAAAGAAVLLNNNKGPTTPTNPTFASPS
jgi:hypothetical protein